MKFQFSTIALSYALFGASNALPATSAAPTSSPVPFAYNTLNFKFNAATAHYTLKFPADGNTYPTNNGLSVSTIQTHGYSAALCTFYDPSHNPIYPPRVTVTQKGADVGPPQPIGFVQCAPAANQCFPNYATCEFSSPATGTFLANCCSGYCAATKCRPTTNNP